MGDDSIHYVYSEVMSLALALLGILASHPGHGYDLKRTYDDRFMGSRPLAYGQVYATLARLERDERVQIVDVVQDGGPERTTYAITSAGKEALDAWLDKSEDPGPYPAEELVRKTVTALHLGADAAGFLRRQRTTHLDVMRDLVCLRTETHEPGARIVMDHMIFHLDADLLWLEAAGEHLRSQRSAR